MMSTGMRTLFQFGLQKNLKSLYQSFVPQKFASAHVCANRYKRKIVGCEEWLRADTCQAAPANVTNRYS